MKQKNIPEPEEVARCAGNPKNVIGNYVVVQPVGRGAMGAVYKAWDRAAGRWVAIKVLLGGEEDLHLFLRFRREVETAASLDHPNIVPTYDVGQTAGRPFMVMKFIEGTTLVGRTSPAAEAAALMLQASKGVGFAHGRNIIHRDLKPANVMVDRAGQVFVMDFGLAKDLFTSLRITAPGTVMGTPSFMPPEQAAGRIHEVDRSSDVYSLGAILYALVTGRPPFRAEQVSQTIRQVLTVPVIPPSRLRPETPPELERIILRALEKDRAKRYPTGAELAEALDQFLGAPAAQNPVVLPERKPSRSKSRIWVVLLLLLAVLAGLGFYRFGWPIPRW